MCRASALRAARNLTTAGAVAATALASLTLMLALAGRAVAQTPLADAPTMIDGPSSDITALSGFSVARDGTGALVYLKAVDGTPHVFVSRLLDGVFTAPEQADVGLPGASSQPVVAAGNGGVVLIGFVNGGELFVVDRAGAQSAATAPIPLAGGGITNPSISISNFGKAYMSFTAPGDGGHDIRVAAYAFGIWALESTPMDANPSDDAGAGTARSQVATAGDGVAVVAWGEAGHVYTRRIRGTAPSVVFEQADVPSVGGASEVSADLPSVGTGGDSSYAAVAFRELVASGVQHQSRVLMRRLHGSIMETLTAADGLSTPGTTNATNPATVATEFGRGYVTAVRDDNKVWVMSLNGNDAPGPTSQLDSLNDFSQPIAVPALAGLFSDYVAWQQDPGPLGSPEIRMRYADASGVLGGELVLSEPDLGATDAARGLAAAGDVTGNAAVAWIQGSGADTRIMVAQLYVPPGGLATNTTFQYARTSQPSLGWSAARDQWGPVRYTLYVDGRPLGPVTGTALRPPLAAPRRAALVGGGRHQPGRSAEHQPDLDRVGRRRQARGQAHTRRSQTRRLRTARLRHLHRRSAAGARQPGLGDRRRVHRLGRQAPLPHHARQVPRLLAGRPVHAPDRRHRPGRQQHDDQADDQGRAEAQAEAEAEAEKEEEADEEEDDPSAREPPMSALLRAGLCSA